MNCHWKIMSTLGAALLLGACGNDTQTAGGGDDFPNSLGPVLAKGLSDWSEGRTLRPDQEGVVAEAAAGMAVEPSSALSKSAVLAKLTFDLSDSAAGYVTIFSHDTTVLRIVADTVTVAWDAYAKDPVQDNENVLYFAERKIRRATGAYEYQRMVPLDQYVRGPEVDSARIRMRVERQNWRSGLLDGAADVLETLDMDFVHIPADTLRDFPLYYKENVYNTTRRMETRLLTLAGDSVLVPGADLLLRKVHFVDGDSAKLEEVGLIPGDYPWHGSALSRSFRVVDYAPGNDWKRTEMEFVGDRGYSESEGILEGTFRLVIQRKQGIWVLQGVFDTVRFSGTLTGPDGETQAVDFLR